MLRGFSSWVSAPKLTAAQIKQEYESNPDTNVFSDYEKIKTLRN